MYRCFCPVCSPHGARDCGTRLLNSNYCNLTSAEERGRHARVLPLARSLQVYSARLLCRRAAGARQKYLRPGRSETQPQSKPIHSTTKEESGLFISRFVNALLVFFFCFGFLLCLEALIFSLLPLSFSQTFPGR